MKDKELKDFKASRTNLQAAGHKTVSINGAA